ncbi:MAG: DUF58 domain-containing protein [Clostridia bacterium]|nr:DUF58 domain-containing protein [Clostridia bacterium]
MRKNRVLYFLLFFASLIFVYFYGGKIPYTLFYLVILLPLVSLVYSIYVFFRFKFIEEIDKKFVTKGDIVNYSFSIHNEDILLYPYFNIAFFGDKTIFAKHFMPVSFSLIPKKDKKYSFTLECNYRGVYNVGIKYFEVEDLLGIFRLRYRAISPKVITVYPRIVELERFNIKTNFMSESHSILNQKFEDLTTISDIRNYTYGDSLKKIHWKLSGKLNKLMVKNFQSTSETTATIILDLKKNNYSYEENTIIEDRIIESALSVIYFCLRNWIHTKLLFFNESLVEIEGDNSKDFDEIYRILARISFNNSIDVKDILKIYLEGNIQQNNIFIFTCNLNYELYDHLFKFKLSGCEVTVIYTSPEDLTGVKDADVENILSFLPEIGIHVYKLNIHDDIKAVLER